MKSSYFSHFVWVLLYVLTTEPVRGFLYTLRSSPGGIRQGVNIGACNRFPRRPLVEGSTHGRFRMTQATLDQDRNTSPPPPPFGSEIIGKATVGDVTILIPDASTESPSKFGTKSPVANPTYAQAAQQLTQKAFWFSQGQVRCSVVTISKVSLPALYETDVLIAMGLQSETDLAWMADVFETRRLRDRTLRQRQCHFALDCAPELPSLVGPYDESIPSLRAQFLPWTMDASGKRLEERMKGSFAKWTTDDFTYAIMLFINQFSGSTIDWVKHTTEATWEKGPVRNAQEFISIFTKCNHCIQKCLSEPSCRECVGRLTQIDARDQVESYRTIVSYESEALKEFSQCIMTKNNVFRCDATIPKLPVVEPITTWRGKTLTEGDGRAILVGHLDDASAPEGSRRMHTSWIVACGANVAYDQFPSQNQIFYPASRGRSMWYDPVFRVETLDGRHVWCHRHYRVRPQPKPGTFRFSVLDNGVTSDEYWNIIGVADDLSWVCFHYAGAAAAVGMQYLGGLVCTPDGSLPEPNELPKVWECMRSAGIEPWELVMVDNNPKAPGYIAAGRPPLDIYRSKVMAELA